MGRGFERKRLISSIEDKEYNISGGGTNAGKSSGCKSSSILCIAVGWATAIAARIRSGTGQLRQAGATHSRAPEETRTQFHPYRCEGRHHQSIYVQGKGCSSRFLGDMVRWM